MKLTDGTSITLYKSHKSDINARNVNRVSITYMPQIIKCCVMITELTHT